MRFALKEKTQVGSTCLTCEHTAFFRKGSERPDRCCSHGDHRQRWLRGEQTGSALEAHSLTTEVSKGWDWEDRLECHFYFFQPSFLNGSGSLDTGLGQETDPVSSPLGHTGWAEINKYWPTEWEVPEIQHFMPWPLTTQEDRLWHEQKGPRHFPPYTHRSLNAVKARGGWNAVTTSALENGYISFFRSSSIENP